MKKVISISLAIVFVLLAFAGCSKAPTKEELLAQAVEADASDVSGEAFNNLAAAKQKYCNKVLKLSGTVSEIRDDCVVIGSYYSTNWNFDAYIPAEELLKLQNGQQIVVVGETTDEIIDSSEEVFGSTWDIHNIQMPVAYLVHDTVEKTGVFKGVNGSYSPACNIQIGDSNVSVLVYFADGVDTSKLKNNQEITFKAKCVYEGNAFRYYDAEIVE